MEFRRRDIVVEAVQWKNGSLLHDDLSKFILLYQPPDAVIGGHGEQHFKQKPYYAVQTVFGLVKLKENDWIVVFQDGLVEVLSDEMMRKDYVPTNIKEALKWEEQK